MQDQRGARWLVREREIGAASGSEARVQGLHHTTAATEPPRYPLIERLSAASLAALVQVMGELGMVEANDL